jgi:hypothetical protein
MTAAVVIPFRDRGIDPLRKANLERVLDWWADSPWTPHVVSDGRGGDAQFNRSAAYNLAAAQVDADVIVYTEADMLIPLDQVEQAVALAVDQPGLVVPFTEYLYLSDDASAWVRRGSSPSDHEPQRVKRAGKSIGAVNVVSRETLDLVGGYTERTDGNWYDDDIMRHAFDVCAGPTRWVGGPAWHLYHLPGWRGDHLSAEDKAATKRNRALWRHVQWLSDPDEVRAALHA